MTTATLETGPLDVAGRYTFRVVVTDAAGFHASGFAVVEVIGTLGVTVVVDAAEVLQGSAATMTAEPSGGVSPYAFSWEQTGGPITLALTETESETLTTPPIDRPGQYVFELVMTDSVGAEASAAQTIDVLPDLDTVVPALALVDEPVQLSVGVEPDPGDLSYLWEIASGPADVDDPTSREPNLTATAPGSIMLELTVTVGADGETPVASTRSFEIVSIAHQSPRVVIETNLGAITIELDADAAPLHSANFLLHVDEGFYDGVLFHRSACSDQPVDGQCAEPFVVQAGGFRRAGEELEPVESPRDTVPSEADNGLSNSVIYSVALALSAAGPDSGTTEFFINLADNGFLDDQAFTVFAMVVDGFDVVDAIVALDRTVSPVLGGEVSLPVEDVIMERVGRVTR